MKIKLLILNLLIFNVCFGQRESLQKYLDSCKCSLSTNSRFSGDGNVIYLFPSEHNKDTVKVIMTACDTVSAYNVFWRVGYLVREKHNTSESSNDSQSCLNCEWEDYYINLYYLDEKKKPLPKSFIVWDSKLIH